MSDEAAADSTGDAASGQSSASSAASRDAMSEDSPSESDADAAADTETTMSSNSSASASSASDVDQPSDNAAADADPTNDGPQPDDVDADADADTDNTATDAPADGAGDAAADDEADAANEPAHVPDRFTATAERAILDDFFDAVGQLVDECKLHISPDGISVSAVDPANVVMIDLELDAEAFETFDATEGVIGINVGRMGDATGLANKRDLVSFELNSEARELAVEGNDIEYGLRLIDPDSIREEPKEPDLKLNAELTVDNQLLRSSIKAAEMVSEYVELSLAKRQPRGFTFRMVADGGTDSINVAKEDTADAISDSTFAGGVKSMYSLDYLSDIRRALPNSGETELELGDNLPIKLHFSKDDVLTGTYMLAPRIET